MLLLLFATGATIETGAFSADGVATVSGVGRSTAEAILAAAGTATASGVGASTATSVFAAAGQAAVSGVGAPLGVGVFAAAGIASVSGTGTGVFSAVMAANGLADVNGISIISPITDTETIQLPVNCVLHGEQRITGHGREWEIRARNRKEVTTGMRSGVKALGGKSGFTVRTDHRGYD